MATQFAHLTFDVFVCVPESATLPKSSDDYGKSISSTLTTTTNQLLQYAADDKWLAEETATTTSTMSA